MLNRLVANGNLNELKYVYENIVKPRMKKPEKKFKIDWKPLREALKKKYFNVIVYALKNFNCEYNHKSFLEEVCVSPGNYYILNQVLDKQTFIKNLYKIALSNGNVNYARLIARPNTTKPVNAEYISLSQTKALLYFLEAHPSTKVTIYPNLCRHSDAMYNFKLALKNKNIEYQLHLFIIDCIKNRDWHMLQFMLNRKDQLKMEPHEQFICTRFTTLINRKEISPNPKEIKHLLSIRYGYFYLHHLRINKLLIKDDFKEIGYNTLKTVSRDRGSGDDKRIKFFLKNLKFNGKPIFEKPIKK